MSLPVWSRFFQGVLPQKEVCLQEGMPPKGVGGVCFGGDPGSASKTGGAHPTGMHSC